jgi:hypothetical protein
MGNGFLGGIEFAFLLLLMAFASIACLNALAELTVVSVEIALNTRGMRIALAQTAPVPPPVAPQAAHWPRRQLPPRWSSLPSFNPADATIADDLSIREPLFGADVVNQ